MLSIHKMTTELLIKSPITGKLGDVKLKVREITGNQAKPGIENSCCEIPLCQPKSVDCLRTQAD